MQTTAAVYCLIDYFICENLGKSATVNSQKVLCREVSHKHFWPCLLEVYLRT